MKKILSLALVAAMLVSAAALTACDKSGDNTTSTPPASSNTPAGSNGDTTSGVPGDNTDPAQTTPDDGPISIPTASSGYEYRGYDPIDNLEEFKANYSNLMPDHYVGYNYDLSISSGRDYTGDEHIDKPEYGTTEMGPGMLDGDESTKWCSLDDPSFNSAIVWEMDQAVNVVGYSFTTANDNETYTNRNIISWRLYASNQAPTIRMDSENEENGMTYLESETIPAADGWVLIDAVDAAYPDSMMDSQLPDENYKEVGFLLPNAGSYQYFMLLIDYAESNTIQYCEFTLYGSAD